MQSMTSVSLPLATLEHMAIKREIDQISQS